MFQEDGESYTMKSFVLFTKSHSDNETKEDEMGGLCSANGGK